METLAEAIKGPEFWMSVAFCLLIVVSYAPVRRYLSTWGSKRAQGVTDKIEQAAALRREAEDLLAQYEGHTKNREAEKEALIAEGEQAVRVMQEEMDEALKNRIAQKKKDTADKIDLMHKTVQQNLKKDILKKVVQKTTEQWEKRATIETESDMDMALERAYAALSQNLNLVQK